MERPRIENEDRERALAIGHALRLTIPVARKLGWNSTRAYREAEAWAAARARL
jgi:hypothetical protein